MPQVTGWKKRYVGVTARIDEEGRMRPLSVHWYNGFTYPIDEVVSVKKEPPRRVAAGAELCFVVRIGQKETRLWFEGYRHRWFVEESIYECSPC